MRLPQAETIIMAEGLTAAAISRAAATAMHEVEPQSDIHASGDYRRALVEVLFDRTIRKAVDLKGGQ